MTRIVFLGTPEEAVPSLELLAERFQVGLVVTRPDRPRGRSGAPQPSAVKRRAEELGIEIAQPAARSEVGPAIATEGDFDLGVVVAYGVILGRDSLESPRHGMLNVHFSLLPRWRGAAPVARALMAGDTMTGVTIIKLDETLDTGPVLTAQAVDIGREENAGELSARLSRLGARLVASVIPGYVGGEIEPEPQIDEGASYAEKISSEDRPLDLELTPAEFVAKVRGLAPEPAATLTIDAETYKILAARESDRSPGSGIWELDDGVPVVGLAGGGVELVVMQPPGKRPQPGEDWARGRRRFRGTVD